MRTIRKDIDETIAVGFDWSDRLDSGETITSSSWTVDVGIIGANSNYTNTETDLEVSSGELGGDYKVSNTIETSNGLTYTRSLKIVGCER